MRIRTSALALAAVGALAAGSSWAAKGVDGASIQANTAKTEQWPSIGLDYAETRFSKLTQVNTQNAKDLGLTDVMAAGVDEIYLIACLDVMRLNVFNVLSTVHFVSFQVPFVSSFLTSRGIRTFRENDQERRM
mgnify:CR=1 FL=1